MSDVGAVPFTIVADILASNVPAGGGQFIERPGRIIGIKFRCPCGCGALMAVIFGLGNWSFDGNRARPTVAPALHSPGGCGWNGELVDGTFRANRGVGE